MSAHPEIARLVDFSAPAWCQLGTDDRTVFDLSAAAHGPIDHVEQVRGEMIVSMAIGLGDPPEQKPSPDVAFDTGFGRLEVCTVTRGVIEDSGDTQKIAIFLDHGANPNFDLAILTVLDEERTRGQLLGGIRVDDILQAPIMAIRGRRVHVATRFSPLAELMQGEIGRKGAHGTES